MNTSLLRFFYFFIFLAVSGFTTISANWLSSYSIEESYTQTTSYSEIDLSNNIFSTSYSDTNDFKIFCIPEIENIEIEECNPYTRKLSHKQPEYHISFQYLKSLLDRPSNLQHNYALYFDKSPVKLHVRLEVFLI